MLPKEDVSVKRRKPRVRQQREAKGPLTEVPVAGVGRWKDIGSEISITRDYLRGQDAR